MADKPHVNTEEAAEIAAMLLARKAPKHIIRKALQTQYKGRKKVSARSFERILARGRELIEKDWGKTRKEMRLESKAHYESTIADPATKTSDRLRAQEDLDKLLRLAIPERVILSGTGEGGAIKTENKSTVEILAERVQKFDFDALRAAMIKTREGTGADDANRN